MTAKYQDYQEIATFLQARLKKRAKIAIILGTALGGLAAEIEDAVTIPYQDIPCFLRSTVSSHAGLLVEGKLANVDILCLSGRFHYYEGYSYADLALPIRVLKLLGIETLILTNAAGAINLNYSPGELMLIKDHLNLLGASPNRGENIEELGPRFFDISTIYADDLRALVKSKAKQLGICLHEGVYSYVHGPHFETPAEIKALRLLGADAVGMSTVPEVLTAAHLGLKVLAISMLSNMAAGILAEDAPISQVEVVGKASTPALISLIKAVLPAICKL